MFKKIIVPAFFLLFNTAFAYPIIDEDVFNELTASHSKVDDRIISLFLFFREAKDSTLFISEMSKNKNYFIKPLNFMPVVIVTFPKNADLYQEILKHKKIKYIALNKPAGEKIELNPESNKPKVPFRYPGIDLWWDHGYKGQSGVIGIIDSGVAIDHPALINKKIIVNTNENSQYRNHPYGVRSPHGTGIACIYAGYPNSKDKMIRGVAYKTSTILSTLAGEGSKQLDDFWLTYNSLNWMLTLPKLKPSIINYSFGNGDVTCSSCPDWSGMSKIVDYIINQKQILWVTSSGNNGYIAPSKTFPFASTMTVPADSYNGLTVANMNMYSSADNKSKRKFSREDHAIRYTSSRGPTLIGRKKPDITAPGNDTYTCAPDPKKYHITYPEDNYKKGYRLMGGTSSAAPHVGGAILLLQEAGIVNPMAIKALLINSTDSWTDSHQRGPDDPDYRYRGGHHPVGGSEWNPTYGWGYMNLQTAFYQRKKIIIDALSLKKTSFQYYLKMDHDDKVTVVHERRVGFNAKGTLWNLSVIQLELIDAKTNQLLAKDESLIDNVHQVSLCNAAQLKSCFQLKPRDVMVRVTLLSKDIEGSDKEPFALAYSGNLLLKS